MSGVSKALWLLPRIITGFHKHYNQSQETGISHRSKGPGSSVKAKSLGNSSPLISTFKGEGDLTSDKKLWIYGGILKCPCCTK